MNGWNAPEGQMELRLEACQDAGLTDIEVETEVETGPSVTAMWSSSGETFYMFTVSPGGGTPALVWQEITTIYLRMETYPDTIETIRTQKQGPLLGLSELLAMDDADGPLPTYWREVAAALIGIYEVAAEDIQECMEEAASEASRAASERLTERFKQPAEPPPVPSVEECFAAFQAACQRRAPYCNAIVMSWDGDFDGPPHVEFGIAVNTPGQVLYKVDHGSDGQLYLNGFWPGRRSLEEDLLEQFPDDAWARLGARNAARDLLEIQRTGQELMDAQKQDTLQDMDRRRLEDKLDSMAQGTPLKNESNGLTPAWQWDCEVLWERIKECLTDLKPQLRVQPEE
ncbi:hypothetical protein AB4Y72_16530 [Arthrobacter sp. YAF34]|uniref:hypothetical protein n=1 Tax=Arthrobacter sp. YAF34 TaxID=3233083 RepID=UPI003F8ECA83